MSWTAPVGGTPVSTYRVFRYACTDVQVGQRYCLDGDDGDFLTTVTAPEVSYADTGVTVNQLYCYSVQSVAAGGEQSNCSNIDPGYASAPPNYDVPSVAASDGAYTNKVRVTWIKPGSGSPFTNFELHRSTFCRPAGLFYRNALSDHSWG